MSCNCTSCGTIKFLEGGAIQNTNMIGGSITGACIASSTLDASSITRLNFIDQASAQVLATALSQLPAAYLAVLAKALLDVSKCSGCAMPPPPIPLVPATPPPPPEDEDDDDDGTEETTTPYVEND